MLKLMNILGVNISAVDIPKACAYIEGRIAGKEKTYICVAPVSTVVDCQKDTEYRGIINGAGMTTPDGMPLVWLGRLKGEPTIERTYGPDLMLAMCALSEAKGYKHYFYGGTEKTDQLLILKLRQQFPGLNIGGYFAPPFRAVGEVEDESVLRQINEANPDIVWVGLGSPKQDYWMYQHRDKLNVPVMVGVGAAFDFLAGVKKQAPVWMRKSGLEWLFRLCSEPCRLWRRYLIGNTKFLYYLLRDSFRRA
jgi:N-acetylglucosaminyldiphosphoundecaprenol N-acetyl-beta-D-mannosaminyltransferase